MTVEFESFCESPRGEAFIQGGGFRDSEARQCFPNPAVSTCCCLEYVWRMDECESAPNSWDWPWPVGIICRPVTKRYQRCIDIRWSQFSVYPPWTRMIGGIDNPPPELTVYHPIPDEEAAEAYCQFLSEPRDVHLWLYYKKFFVEGTWVLEDFRYEPTNTNWQADCHCDSHDGDGEPRWNAPCHCNSTSGEPVDFEERCDHIEDCCCVLVLGEWQLSLDGCDTWQRDCTIETQQRYYAAPIEQVAFIRNPDDPAHPCPSDPPEPGWCCITFVDLTTWSSLELGNESEDECTFIIQRDIWAQLGFGVISVKWLGPVEDDGCNPCGIPEGTCCLGGEVGVPPRGLCMVGLTPDECYHIPWSIFHRGIDACTNCYEPEPLDERPPWLGPRGRCCTTYEHRAPGSYSWIPQSDCSYREEYGPYPSCEWFRDSRENDPDHYRYVQGEPWTIHHECIRDADDDGETTWTEQMCASVQGWCCREGDTGNAEWRARDRCDRSGDLFYDPLVDPFELCGGEASQPCCRTNENGVLFCDVLRREECRRLGGVIKGEPGDGCYTRDDEGNLVTECEAGACCLGCSRCTDNMPPWECESMLGQYRGHGTRCYEIDDCPEGPI